MTQTEIFGTARAEIRYECAGLARLGLPRLSCPKGRGYVFPLNQPQHAVNTCPSKLNERMEFLSALQHGFDNRKPSLFGIVSPCLPSTFPLTVVRAPF